MWATTTLLIASLLLG